MSADPDLSGNWRMKNDVLGLVPAPFSHFGIGRLARIETTRCGNDAQKIALLGDLEGAGDRIRSIGGADHGGGTAIASHGENAHHASFVARARGEIIKWREIKIN